ncbi:hypothetical protein GCM10009552_34720 [Rothia nasimurium]|uniref:Glycosyltransferase n=1 Tax=Luteibacter anthropi TaxID=564369 RepID=A0A7X5UEE0_9GAMM|nr:glycosyltransferase [Luteibacter anthropi]
MSDNFPAPQRLDVVVPMYRNADKASMAIDALLACRPPLDTKVRIRVVDDGSGDGTPDMIEQSFGDRIDLIRLADNRGRSGARNAAAMTSDARYILFLDSDCIPIGEDFLVDHVQAITAAEVSIGRIVGQDDGFWHDYQDAATHRRNALAMHTPSATFTTQNVMIARSSFIDAGGFDEAYIGYGFEDRDLAIRLANAGARFVCAPLAAVSHRDTLSLEGVCRKMGEAGAVTSLRFSDLYPDEYRGLGYAAIDARIHPWRGEIAAGAWFFLRHLTRWESWLAAPWIPFRIKALLVRITVAAAFMDGTRRSRE